MPTDMPHCYCRNRNGRDLVTGSVLDRAQEHVLGAPLRLAWTMSYLGSKYRVLLLVAALAVTAFSIACGSSEPTTTTRVRPTSTPRPTVPPRTSQVNLTSNSSQSSAAANSDTHASADDSTSHADDSHEVTADSHDDGHAESDDGHAAEGDAGGHEDDGHDADAHEDDGHGGAPHCEYIGPVGIDKWGGLHDLFTACVDGGAQSPIDVRQAVEKDLLNLEFQYSPARAGLVNNGHTIQANFIGGSPGTMVHAGKEYTLLQFHFHRPSEHTVNGYQYGMEAHLVHQAEDGSRAVVGILIDPGDPNPAFDAIWGSMPGAEGEVIEMGSLFDVEAMLPDSRTTYRYPGSLTTPPCSEGVQWLLMSEPVHVAQSDIDAYKNLYFFNARYTQPINGRTIVLDNSAAE